MREAGVEAGGGGRERERARERERESLAFGLQVDERAKEYVRESLELGLLDNTDEYRCISPNDSFI